MGQHQKHLRRAAAQAFMNSLNQLEQTLCREEPSPQVVPPTPAKAAQPPEDLAITPAELDEAVADIEQFMQHQDDWQHPANHATNHPANPFAQAPRSEAS
ncbi:hypothetical protein [Alkalinema sp. FACHB-956]|uniref:hypothetical protein n=1 Tax=Alkalinema sp. FACHB-956 TaxID=2692768 RepID=UPI001689B46B|nr:hypothetical protein [Alkalinema sp. FACHB-956]MBD2329385.1 hypothetical protein [Alkalinema sp. FACHB-956]